MSTKITYNGKTTELADGYIATLPCKDLKMETDVVVEAPEGSGGANVELQEKSVTITENTTTTLEAGEGKAFSKVEITTAIKQNYCLVRFYNDDRTTLLYEVLVPYGSSAVYAGDAPVSSLGADYTFTGFEPSTAKVTADIDCYAVYDEPVVPEVTTLGAASWADISAISATGTAANYFAIGDTKAVTLNGNVGDFLTLNNETYYVYIIGFNHNSAIEGNGITFGTFKNAAGKDIALVDSKLSTSIEDGSKCFNMQHWGGSNYGGWVGCDMRYDILGSTDVAPSGYGAIAVTGERVGYNPTNNCTTNPVANTLMAALPSDLRAVMKPMTKYTDSVGGYTADEAQGNDLTKAKVTASIDYLPLIAEYEVQGTRTNANAYEQEQQAQYAYYAAGNSKIKYDHTNPNNAVFWTLRSVKWGVHDAYCRVQKDGATGAPTAKYVQSIAPIFKV